MIFLKDFSRLPRYALDIFYPNDCALCSHSLNTAEEFLCLKCRYELPYLSENDLKKASRIFDARLEIHSIHSLLQYDKSNQVSALLKQIKYKGKTRMTEHLGSMIADRIQESSIDCIVPLPLHPKKQRQRGYNQSLFLANGIASKLQLPVNDKLLKRIKHTSSQTKVSKYERWDNVRKVFALRNNKLYNQHILLVDDVLTTGATLEAAARILISESNCKVSIATLAVRL